MDCIDIVVILMLLVKGSLSNVVLTPSLAQVIAYNSFNFTCTYNGTTRLTGVAMKRQDITKEVEFGPGCDKFEMNETLYEFYCDADFKTFLFTIRSVRTQDQWWCEVSPQTNPSGEKSNTVYLDVHEPPSTPEFKIGNYTIEGSDEVRLIRGSNVSVKCTSWGIPTPDKYIWTLANGTTYEDQTLMITYVQSINENQYSCTVENVMVGNITGRNNGSIYFDVLYPPLPPTFIYNNDGNNTVMDSLVVVVIGDSFNISCQALSNPTSTYTWDGNVDGPTVMFEGISDDMNRTCTAENMMVSTTGGNVNGSSSSWIKVSVLYPPIRPDISYNYNISNIKMRLPERALFFEETTIYLHCLADSNPAPTYTWTHGVSSLNASVWDTDTDFGSIKLNNISRRDNGTYTCKTTNNMTRTFGTWTLGTNQTNSPIVENMEQLSVEEGQSINTSCTYTPGYPVDTNITWSLLNETHVTGRSLILDNVSRTDSGDYTCTATNNMNPTDGDSRTGNHSATLNLNVLFPAKVTDFFALGEKYDYTNTTKEGEVLTLVCKVEGNPNATIVITKDEQQELQATTGHGLNYSIDARCQDTGVYSCKAENDYNDESSELTDVFIYVLCSPRPSNDSKLITNIRVVEHDSATLAFNTEAYPAPNQSDYVWEKFNQSSWRVLTSGGNINANVTTDGLRGTLTILDVGESDYGEYRLNISNTEGSYSVIYNVLRPDSPDPPYDLKYTNITQTTVVILWIPGNDNGGDQTFHIEYKILSAVLWTRIDIPENENKQKLTLSYTISGLLSGTLYNARMFARNEFGQSGMSQNLTFKTLSSEETTSRDPSLYIIIGACVGVVVAVVTISLVIYVRCKRRDKTVKANNGNEEQQQQQPQYVT